MSPRRILIIEDDTLLVQMYKTKFTMEGYEVVTASDGEQGFVMTKQYKPDFIIMDVMMPKLSGIELVSLIRQDPLVKNTPIIMLSNLGQPQEIERAKTLGVKEFLLKANYTPSQIVEKVKLYLSSNTG